MTLSPTERQEYLKLKAKMELDLMREAVGDPASYYMVPIGEVERELGLTRRTIKKLLPVTEMAGRLKVSRLAIREYIESHTTKPERITS